MAEADDVEGVAEAGDAEDVTSDEDEVSGDVPRTTGQPSAPQKFAHKPNLIIVGSGLS